MHNKIRAIPVNYKGTEFRSKLEARYASAFDNLAIKWAYEVQAYKYNNINYLPDFYLPEMNVLFEVKGPNIPGIEKPTRLMEIIESGTLPGGDWWNPAVLVVIGDANGRLTIPGSEERAILSKCAECQKSFFFAKERSFECRICGEYDGDHHLHGWTNKLELPQFV